MRKIKNRKGADAQLEVSRRYMSKGLCGHCGRECEQGRHSCTSCLSVTSIRNYKIREWKKFKGECTKTGCENPVEFEKTICNACLAINRVAHRARRGDLEAIKAYRDILKGRLAQRVALDGLSDDRRTMNALKRLDRLEAQTT